MSQLDGVNIYTAFNLFPIQISDVCVRERKRERESPSGSRSSDGGDLGL